MLSRLRDALVRHFLQECVEGVRLNPRERFGHVRDRGQLGRYRLRRNEVTERAGAVVDGMRAMLKRDGAEAGATNVDVNQVIRIRTGETGAAAV